MGLVLACADLAGPVLGEGHPVALVSRAALSSACHQRAERSLHVGGRPLASCARCSGLHAAGLAGGALLLLLPSAAAAALPRPRLMALVALAPLALDVAAGLLWSSWDHPWLRAATGLLAGCAILLSLRATAPETETNPR
jgi:uncharacterized membrane protein